MTQEIGRVFNVSCDKVYIDGKRLEELTKLCYYYVKQGRMEVHYVICMLPEVHYLPEG